MPISAKHVTLPRTLPRASPRYIHFCYSPHVHEGINDWPRARHKQIVRCHGRIARTRHRPAMDVADERSAACRRAQARRVSDAGNSALNAI